MVAQVLLQKREGVTCCLQDHLGHCPQEDPLWPDLTVHQHLQVYAAVKGVRKEDTAAAVNRYGAGCCQVLAKVLSPFLRHSEGTRRSKSSGSQGAPWKELGKRICKSDFVLNAAIK